MTLASADYEFVGEGSGDSAGYTVANAGDVDGDGLADILVGAYGNDDGGGDKGQAYLFYGKTLGDRTRINLARADYGFVGRLRWTLGGRRRGRRGRQVRHPDWGVL